MVLASARTGQSFANPATVQEPLRGLLHSLMKEVFSQDAPDASIILQGAPDSSTRFKESAHTPSGCSFAVQHSSVLFGAFVLIDRPVYNITCSAQSALVATG